MARIQKHVTRSKSWVRIRLMGASNSGKTLSALYLALGLTGGRVENGRIVGGRMDRVIVVDSERERSKLFAPAFDNQFSVLRLDPPFSPERYIEAMHEIAAERDGDSQFYEVVIIDSGSHEWNGSGGIMSESDRIKAQAGARKLDLQRDVWGQLTPRHDKFVYECIIAPQMHVIFTTRAKGEYEDVDLGNGKKKRVKVGLQDVQREGLEYEFTFGWRLEGDHYAHVEKDTSLLPGGGSLFDGHPAIILTPETGAKILAWVESGAGVLPVSAKPPSMGVVPGDQQQPGAAAGNGTVGQQMTPEEREENEVNALRARLLDLFKTALNTRDRDTLTKALGTMSEAILPTGERRTSFRGLTRLEVSTLIKAVERSPAEPKWYDIAQQREIPKPQTTTTQAMAEQQGLDLAITTDDVEELATSDLL
jgi:hypothetical protein